MMAQAGRLAPVDNAFPELVLNSQLGQGTAIFTLQGCVRPYTKLPHLNSTVARVRLRVLVGRVQLQSFTLW